MRRIGLALMSVAALVLAGCSTVDCSLNNTSLLRCGFYAGGQKVSITDMLTVSACGTDTILINQEYNASGMILPMSYSNSIDTLVLHVGGDDYQIRDSIWIEKQNIPHFESPECPTNMFHRILSVRHTGNFIDSITINRAKVDYDQTENIQIHLLADD